MAPNQQLLVADSLHVDYRTSAGCVSALSSVGFQLGVGESLGIVGETGSGKTTLGQALLGLIRPPHRVTGRVLYQGRDLLTMDKQELRQYRWRKLAISFQNSEEVLNPVMTIGDQMSEPLREHLGLSRQASIDRVERLLEMTRLDAKWRTAYPHQLSGGMRQRVLLAMALSCDPELLIVDEPTTNLDPHTRQEILDLLTSLRRRSALTMIVISHDLQTISCLTDRLIVLYNGKSLEEGPSAALLESPEHPYTRGLLGSAVELFPYRDLWGIPGEPPVPGMPGCSFAPRCTQAEENCLVKAPPVYEIGLGRQVRCHKRGIARIVSAENLTKVYRLGKQRLTVVDHASLGIRHGETVALVGPSGSGKSTLAGMIAGFVEPDSGQVLFRDRTLGVGEVSRHEGGMQLVLQDPQAATSHRFTVLRAVAEPLVINGIGSTEEQHHRTREILRQVQLPHDPGFLKRYCYSLSGGQRQRVAIARAMIMRPAVLIADEITAMLDVSTQANILRLLKGLQNTEGFSLLFITHDLGLARKIAERVLLMTEGTVRPKSVMKSFLWEEGCNGTEAARES